MTFVSSEIFGKGYITLTDNKKETQTQISESYEFQFKVFIGYREKYKWGDVKNSIFRIIAIFLNVIKNFQDAIQTR